MSLLTKFLSVYYKSGFRGSYRLTDLLVRHIKSLHCVPISTQSGILYVDLRISSSRGLLASPKSHSGEDIIMRHIVKEGDVVFDIGANFGFYTLLLSELVGKNGMLFAFEPNWEILPSLAKTVEPLANSKLLPVALSDREGEFNLFVPEDASMASLRDWTDGIVGDVHAVKCTTRVLDTLVENGDLPVPQFIKCDVEGAELLIFKGASKILNRVNAPVLLFELNKKAAFAFEATTTAYFEFLESLDLPGYRFFEVTKDGLRDLHSKEIEYTNILAIPGAMSDFHLPKFR